MNSSTAPGPDETPASDPSSGQKAEAGTSPVPQALKARVTFGLAWILLGTASQKVAFLIEGLVVFQCIDPDNFGLFQAVMIPYTILQYGTDIALTQCAVQYRGDPARVRTLLNTAWTISLIRGVAIGLALAGYGLAMPEWSSPKARFVVLALALVHPIAGLTNPYTSLYDRSLNYRRMELYDRISAVMQCLLTIAIVAFVPDARALPAAMVIGVIFRLMFSYVIIGDRPRLCWDGRSARDIWSYGRHALGISLLAGVIILMDRTVVQKLWGDHALGLYMFAATLATGTFTNIGDILYRALFPAFAVVQTDEARLGRGFLQAFRFGSAFTLIFGGMLVFQADRMVELLYGFQWREAVTVVRIFGGMTLLITMNRLLDFALRARGRPDIPFRSVCIMLVVFAVPVYPAALRLGVPGVASVMVVANTTTLIYLFVRGAPLLGVRCRDLWIVFARTILAAALAGGIVMASASLLGFDAWWDHTLAAFDAGRMASTLPLRKYLFQPGVAGEALKLFGALTIALLAQAIFFIAITLGWDRSLRKDAREIWVILRNRLAGHFTEPAR